MTCHHVRLHDNSRTSNPVTAAATLAAALLLLLAATPANADGDAPAEDAGEARFLSRVRQVTIEGRRAGEGYFSADGNKLVFQSERVEGNPFYQIFALDLETGDVSRVSPGTGKTTCSWFQPGTDRVMYASTELDPDAKKDQQDELDARASGRERRYAWDYDEDFDIFLSAAPNADGSYPQDVPSTRLTSARGYDAEGAFSPDGEMIVFSSNRAIYAAPAEEVDADHLALDPAYYCDIYTMRADGSDVRRLTDVPGYDGGPFFTADGERIIWRRFDEKGLTADVYTMNVDGSDVRRLTDFGAMSWAPYMHPSGDYAVFASNKMGFSNFEVFMVDAAGLREPVRVTTTDGFDGLPVFSPDGTMLAWTSNRTSNGQSQIFFANWNDEAARAALEESPMRPAGMLAMGDPMDAEGDPMTAPKSIADDIEIELPPLPEPASGPTGRTTRERIRHDLTYLASDELEGRGTGTEGERKAAAYIRQRLIDIGVEPFDSDGDYLEPFQFVQGTSLGENNKLEFWIAGPAVPEASEVARNPHAEPVSTSASHSTTTTMDVHAGDPHATNPHGGPHAANPHAANPHGDNGHGDNPHAAPTSPPTTETNATTDVHAMHAQADPAESYRDEAEEIIEFEAAEDFTPLAFSDSGTVSAPVVFAGYGLFVAGETPYDSFDQLDVENKWVMVLRYAPEDVTGIERNALFQYSALRYKALLARQRGALGLIVAQGPNSPGRRTLISLKGDAAGMSSGLSALHIMPGAADRLLAQAGTSLQEMQDLLDGGDPIRGFEIPNVWVSATTDLHIDTAVGYNVLGVLPPTGGVQDDTTFYVVGAHYDHLGYGRQGGSLAVEDEANRIHNGADDNASGVTGVIAAAEALARRGSVGRNHGIVLGFWSGEELGLVGCQEWLDSIPELASRFAGYVNLDMVGRLRGNDLSVQAMASSPDWAGIVERANIQAGFSLSLSDDPYVPTDAMAFYLADIPSLALFTGTHDDYHRPSDDADRINYEGIERVADFTARIVTALVRKIEPIEFAKVERSGSMELATRAVMRVTLGTIPDYAAGDVKGVLLSGARQDSPAAKAGVEAGDVVVKLGEYDITNIYDYTYAIDMLRADTAVPLVVERNGERLDLEITPVAR